MSTRVQKPDRDTHKPDRWGSMAGMLWFLGFAAAVALGPSGSPVVESPVAELRAWYGVVQPDNQLGGAILILAIGALIWFTGSLRRAIDRVEPDGRLAGIAAVAGVVAATLLLAGVAHTIQWAMFADSLAGLDDASLTVFHLGLMNSSGLTGVATIAWGIMALAVAVAGFRHGFGSRWMAWVAAVTAGTSLLGVLNVIQPTEDSLGAIFWFAGFLLFPIWIGLLSVQVTRENRRT